MPAERTVDDFLASPPGVPIIDARTPDEFTAGHTSREAVNVPLFSNEERAEIGTSYKQQGRSRVVQLGLRSVGLAGQLQYPLEPIWKNTVHTLTTRK